MFTDMVGYSGYFGYEDKQEICTLLCETLQHTNNCRGDLLRIIYHEEDETVEVVFLNGTRVVNVAMDSGTAMIRDIMTHLGC